MDDLRALWLECKRLGVHTREGRALYQERVWPVVLAGFTDRPARTYGASFHTVGTSPEPVILAARAISAGRVYLVHTAETAGLCRRIVAEVGRPAAEVSLAEVGRSDPEGLYARLSLELGRLPPDAALAFDPTSGTKAMVAGVAMFAFALAARGRVSHVYYVDNREYDEEARRPVPGTEFLKRLPDPLEAAGGEQAGP